MLDTLAEVASRAWIPETWGTIPACNTRGKLLSMMAQRRWSVMLDTLVEMVSRAWIPGMGYYTGLLR